MTAGPQIDTACPECGAPQAEGLACWDRLGGIIAWEYEDPELLAVHFLTVASYNLQHPASFTEEAIEGLRAMFVEALDNGLTVGEIRRRMADRFEGARRVKRPEGERRPVLRPWSMTVANVYLPDQPTGAADRVRAWATAIRAEL